MSTLQNSASDFARRLDNMVKTGTVAEVDTQRARARVQCGELLSDWIPWMTARAGTTRVWNPLTVGEQVTVLASSGEFGNGVILSGAIFSDANGAPDQTGDFFKVVFPDGAVIAYNHAAGALEASGIQTAKIQAAETVTVDCPQSIFKGDVTVEGRFTFLSGMSGRGGSGATAEIEGNIRVRDGEVSADGIGLKSHTHTGDSGGTTSAANG